MNSNWNIHEKTVLVTGGTGGIGYETARGFDDFQSQQDYQDLPTYAQAKLANLLTSYELARRLNGTQIHVNVADPLGAVDNRYGRKRREFTASKGPGEIVSSVNHSNF